MPTIVIDAGHGGFDSGASYQGRKEKDDNLNLALAVGELLAQRGYRVLYTRTSDVYQSPYEKAQIANERGADYFISFHRNSGENDNTYNGVQTLIYGGSDPRARRIAESIDEELAQEGFKNIGIEERTGLAVLRHTKMPAVLIEAGFINHDGDNAIFDSRFDAVAEAIAQGIARAIPLAETIAGQSRAAEEEESGDGTDGTAEKKPVFGVEVGRFTHKTTAGFLAQQLADQGFFSMVSDGGGILHVIAGREHSVEDALQLQKKLRELGYHTMIVTEGRQDF